MIVLKPLLKDVKLKGLPTISKTGEAVLPLVLLVISKFFGYSVERQNERTKLHFQFRLDCY